MIVLAGRDKHSISIVGWPRPSAIVLFIALSLLVVYCLSVNSVMAGSGSVAASAGVLHFPRGYSIGTVAIYTDQERDLPNRKFLQARGDVVVPSGKGMELFLNYQGFTDMSFFANVGAPYLQGLSLERLAVDDTMAEKLKHLIALRNLDAESTEIGDQGMHCFSNMQELRYLDIARTSVTGKSFAVMPRFTKLKRLNAAYNNLDDQAITYLESLKDMEELRLGCSGLGNQALVTFGKLNKLGGLHLEGNSKITDAGIAHLTNLKALFYLDISKTHVTGACLQYLKQMPGLTTLYISLDKFSPREVEAMHKSLPHCQIHDTRKTFTAPIEIFEPLHSPIAPQHLKPH